MTILRKAIQQHLIDAVVFFSLDRFSRDPAHQLVVMADAAYDGIEIISVIDEIDQTPEGQLIQFVKGYAAKREWLQLKERAERGKRGRVASWKPLRAGKPPYGLTWNPVREAYSINEAEAVVLRRIIRWRARRKDARPNSRRRHARGNTVADRQPCMARIQGPTSPV